MFVMAQDVSFLGDSVLSVLGLMQTLCWSPLPQLSKLYEGTPSVTLQVKRILIFGEQNDFLSSLVVHR